MSETSTVFLTYIIPALLLAIPGVYAAIIATRTARSQISLQNGGGADSFASAAQKTAQLNEQYAQKILDLENRLKAVEEEKEYEITVKFKTTTPPELGEVKIVPC